MPSALRLGALSLTYMCVLCIPMPQNMANASTKFSSFFVNTRSSNLLTNCNTNQYICNCEYI